MQVLGSSWSAVILLGWGHGHRVPVRSTILLSPGAPRPLAEALKTKAKFPVGFRPTVVEDQLVTHICFIFLLATPSGEGAASPPQLSRPQLPPFALRARRAQPRGRTLPADPVRDCPPTLWETLLAPVQLPLQSQASAGVGIPASVHHGQRTHTLHRSNRANIFMKG